MDLNFPFKIDGHGRTARVDSIGHIKQLIEQVLLTEIGERVNRPSFGTNIGQLVFAPNSEQLAATTSFLIQGALQQWLGDKIDVKSVDTKNQDSTLLISITYAIKGTEQAQTVQVSRDLG